MDDEILSYNNDIRNKYRYWGVLRLLGDEYRSLDNTDSFVEWVKNRFGFEIVLVNEGYSADYIITNSSKYMFFRLKYNID